MIALRRACGRRDALMVVTFNPIEEDTKVQRVWPLFWRVALASCIVFLVVAGTLAMLRLPH